MTGVTPPQNAVANLPPSNFQRQALTPSPFFEPEDRFVQSAPQVLAPLLLPAAVRQGKKTAGRIINPGFSHHHRRTQVRLREQRELFSRTIADKSERFPEEFEGKFRGSRLGILGDGDWYHGWLSVEFRLDKLADAQGKNRYIFDPKYLDRAGRVDESAIRDSGRDPETIGRVLPSPSDFPAKTRAFVLSPNRFHVDSLGELVKNPNVDAVYVEKPAAIDRAQLKLLDQVVGRTQKPVFFGDHYVYKATGLLKLLGKEPIHANALDLRSDPTGKLGKALRGEEPLLGPIKSVEAVTTFKGADNLLDGRDWLEKGSLGGGVLLDLAVHQFNVLHMLGIQLEAIEETERKIRPNQPDLPRGIFVPLDPKSDLAEDYATVKGRLTGGGAISLKVAQFERDHVNLLSLSDVNGRKAVLNYSTRTVQVFEGETLIGELRCEADPVLLMMDHALQYFGSQDWEPMFYHEHKASIEVIEAIKDFDRA